MSKPRDDWWVSAVRMVINYPKRKEEYEDIHSQSLTAEISGMPSGNGVSRTTENIALRELSPMKQIEYDAVTKAIEATKRMPNGDKRLEMISLMYWKGKRLYIKDVIQTVGVAEATGRRWHARFIKLVGKNAGY